ncbi:Dynein light chain-like protein [Globisporangium polare]
MATGQQHGSDVTYAGWVFKEGSLVKSWKKRFLVVKRAELAYYKNTEQENKAQLLGAMTVARIEKVPDITNGLLLFSVEGRQLKLFTDTQKECDKCFQAIAQYASEQKRGGSDRSAVTPLHDFGASPDSIKHVGWLEKEGQHFKTWKKRYFVLEENVLSYTAQIGSASLGKARVIAARRDLTRPNTLVIMMEGGRELKIGGKTEAEIHEWHKALRKGIMKYGGHRSPAHGGGRMSSPGMGPPGVNSPAYQHSLQTPQRSPLPPPYAASPNVPQSPAGGYNNYAHQQPPPAYAHVSHSPVNRGHEQEHSPLFGSLPEDNAVQHSSDASPFTEEQARKVAERQNRGQHMSFQRHIILEPTLNNGSSFIECEPEQDEKPAAKPWSPKAPGTNTIMQMRLEDKLLLEELEEERQEALAKERALLSAATQQKKRQPDDEATASGPCAPCCIVM